MSEFYNFGLQLRELLRGLIQSEGAVSPFRIEAFPAAGIDEIDPTTRITINIFGKGTETITFPPEKHNIKIRRGQPTKARTGLTTIDTEMVQLQLKGESALLGPLVLRGRSRVSARFGA